MAPKASATNGSAAVPLLQRDLEGARSAFTARDVNASAVAHASKAAAGVAGAPHHSAEPHVQGGEYVKLLVFGGLDGILTSFAIVAGAAGVGLSVKAVLGIGISNVLADALAMGVGEYLSTKSEHEYIREEHARESWEFKNHPDGEVAESAPRRPLGTHAVRPRGAREGLARDGARGTRARPVASAHARHASTAVSMPPPQSTFPRASLTSIC